jgi:hypothetical protein
MASLPNANVAKRSPAISASAAFLMTRQRRFATWLAFPD